MLVRLRMSAGGCHRTSGIAVIARATVTDDTPRPITPPPQRTGAVEVSFGKRSNRRRSAMRVSSRASVAPRQWCSPQPNAEVRIRIAGDVEPCRARRRLRDRDWRP